MLEHFFFNFGHGVNNQHTVVIKMQDAGSTQPLKKIPALPIALFVIFIKPFTSQYLCASFCLTVKRTQIIITPVDDFKIKWTCILNISYLKNTCFGVIVTITTLKIFVCL